MKYPKLLSICSLFLTVFLLTACGKGDDNATVAAAPANVCQAGYGQHPSYGCLPQNHCPVGQGFYQNQCFPVAQTVHPVGGDMCSSYYPGTQLDPNRSGWCSCIPGLTPDYNRGGCY